MTFFEALQHDVMYKASHIILLATYKWNSIIDRSLKNPTVQKYAPKAYTDMVAKILEDTLKPAYRDHAIKHIQYTEILKTMMKEK